MTRYSYRGRDYGGTPVSGTLEGASEADVTAMLVARQITPVLIETSDTARRPGVSIFGHQRSPGLKDWLSIAKRLHYYLRAGMDLSRALRLLELQSQSKTIARTIAALRGHVQAGRPLTSSLPSVDKKFPKQLLGIIQAGEASGALDRAFHSVATLLERQLALRSKLTSALIYPVILSLAALATVVLLSTTVIPRFEPIFAQAGASLPLATQVVVSAADFIQSNWVVCLIAALGAAAILAQANRSATARRSLHRWLLKVPGIGDVVAKSIYGQLAYVWSVQLASGVTLTQAIRNSLISISNDHVRELVEQSLSGITAGRSLARALGHDRGVPVLFREFVDIGERSGRLSDILSELAIIYDAELEQAIQRCVSLITPLATLVLGGIVALVLAALMSAVMAVNDLAV